ncbi:MAG: thioesterase [Lachnospiraceae bacterium]
MENTVFTCRHKVRYSEIDQTGELSIPNIVNYFQDCSNSQSSHLGLGHEYYADKGVAWVLSFWQIVIEKRPKMEEEVLVGTFPYEFKQFMGFRNFFMEDSDGDMIVKAHSIWSFLDMEKGRPVLPTEEMYQKYDLGERLDMNYASRKVKLPNEMEFALQVTVRRDDLDTNHHLNNAKFIAIALEALCKDFEVAQICAEYKKQAYEGDVIYLYTAQMEAGMGICLKDKHGDVYLNVYAQQKEK